MCDPSQCNQIVEYLAKNNMFIVIASLSSILSLLFGTIGFIWQTFSKSKLQDKYDKLILQNNGQIQSGSNNQQAGRDIK